MNKIDVVKQILANKKITTTHDKSDVCFAPINIALIKYWGKSNLQLNLPMTPSVSITSKCLGTSTVLSFSTKDECFFNKKHIEDNTMFYNRIFSFLVLFKTALNCKNIKFRVDTQNNIPTASGVASSASGFCALVFAINDLFDLHLTKQQMATLARLGSGSACRSVYGLKHKFVAWENETVKPLIFGKNDFRNNIDMLVLLLSTAAKQTSSRDAMEITKNNSALYQQWKAQTEHDYKNFLTIDNFSAFGLMCENNAVLLHKAIQQAGINYFNQRTMDVILLVFKLRLGGLQVYFTVDAGANVCLFFQTQDKQQIINKLLTSKLVSKHEILEF